MVSVSVNIWYDDSNEERLRQLSAAYCHFSTGSLARWSTTPTYYNREECHQYQQSKQRDCLQDDSEAGSISSHLPKINLYQCLFYQGIVHTDQSGTNYALHCYLQIYLSPYITESSINNVTTMVYLSGIHPYRSIFMYCIIYCKSISFTILLYPPY